MNLMVYSRKMFIRIGAVLCLALLLTGRMSVRSFAASSSRKKMQVAITFDDGPSDNTREILSILKRYHAKATFFVIGHKIPSRKTQLRAISAAGMEIGNHSYSHTDMTKKKTSAVKTDFQKCSRLIRSVTGKNPTLARLPMGKGRSDAAILKAVGKPNILWTFSVGDSSSTNRATAAGIYRKIMANAKDGSIILMHEWNKESVKALRKVLPALKKKGFEFVTVSQLASSHGIRLRKGKSYTRLSE